MHGGGYILHRRLIPQVPAKPHHGRVHLLGHPAVDRARGAGRLAADRQHRQIDDRAVKAQLAQQVAVLKVRLQFPSQLVYLAALLLREHLLVVPSRGHGLHELPRHGR